MPDPTDNLGSAGAPATTAAPATPVARATLMRHPRAKKGRRRWARWAANLLIIGGILLLAYPLSTWGYTWYEQRGLAQQLQQSQPGLAAATNALYSGDLVAAAPPTTLSVPTTAPATGTGNSTPTTIPPAEAERLGALAAFKAAADAFDATVVKAGQPLGRVVIPSIGVNVVMVEGTGKGDLRKGPGHWLDTPFPGQGGNFVVSGHRTTYGAPFFKINKVKVGDEIDLLLPYGVARYIVTRTMIVDPKDVESVAQAGKEQISLAACHPIYSARQRIVVQGDLVGFKLTQP
jgi:LPXTG-site transpeptidase (sortase) family protein